MGAGLRDTHDLTTTRIWSLVSQGARLGLLSSCPVTGDGSIALVTVSSEEMNEAIIDLLQRRFQREEIVFNGNNPEMEYFNESTNRDLGPGSPLMVLCALLKFRQAFLARMALV